MVGLRRAHGDLVDDALDQDDVRVDVAGDQGYEFSDPGIQLLSPAPVTGHNRIVVMRSL